MGSEDAGANPLVVIMALLYGLYRSIPFLGFAAFYKINFLSGNPSMNRLVRFNMQQATPAVGLVHLRPHLLLARRHTSSASPLTPFA